MKILCKTFEQLSAAQLYDILQLRSDVFVVEQACIYQDIDGKDTQDGVHHLMMIVDDVLIGYARLLPKGISYDDVSIGRVLIARQARGNNLGKTLIAHCLAQIATLWPSQSVTIGAQSHLSGLYQAFGFKEVSPHYLEDGIEHVDMTATEFTYKEFL
jgi:ElaA protein